MEGLLLAVAAVIVTFNSEDVIEDCLRAISRVNALSNAAAQIYAVVVDNASTDQTVERAREHRPAHLIENSANLGFAAAVNQGARRAAPDDFILMLNPDAVVTTSLEPVVEACRKSGLAAGKLVGSDGKAQVGFTVRRFPTPASVMAELLGINKLWPHNTTNRRYRYIERDPDMHGAVEQPAGAFLMVRRDVWDRLEGMDEQFYPVWFEDVDFCHRAVDAGYSIEYVPSVEAVHLGGHAVNKVEAGERATYWCVSLLRYSRKYFPALAFRAVCLGMIVGSVPRMAAGVRTAHSISPVFSYLKIMLYAGACFIRPANVGKALTVRP